MIPALSSLSFRNTRQQRHATVRMGSTTPTATAGVRPPSDKIPKRNAVFVIVDDDPQVRKTFRATLVTAGVKKDRVKIVSSADAFLAILKRTPRPAALRNLNNVVIYLDQNMPGMPGSELAKILLDPKGPYKMPGKNIVFTSSDPLPDDLTPLLTDKSIFPKKYVHIQKPVTYDKVQNAAARLVTGIKHAKRVESAVKHNYTDAPAIVVLHEAMGPSLGNGNIGDDNLSMSGFDHFDDFDKHIKEAPDLVFWNANEFDFTADRLKLTAKKFPRTVFVITNSFDNAPTELKQEAELQGRIHYMDGVMPLFKILRGQNAADRIGGFIKTIAARTNPRDRLADVEKFLTLSA